MSHPFNISDITDIHDIAEITLYAIEFLAIAIMATVFIILGRWACSLVKLAAVLEEEQGR